MMGPKVVWPIVVWGSLCTLDAKPHDQDNPEQRCDPGTGSKTDPERHQCLPLPSRFKIRRSTSSE